MILPAFNFVKLLLQHNATHETNYAENETFGCPYLESTFVAQVNLQITAINEGHDLFLFDEEDKRFNHLQMIAFKTGNARLKLLGRKSIRKSKILMPYTAEEVKTKNTSLHNKDQWYKWLGLQLKVLNGDTFWQDKAILNIDELKQHWIEQRLLARWNDTAIHKIATDILPSLSKHFKRAKKALVSKKHSIPLPIWAAYIAYIKDFEAKATRLQKMLANSMAARLCAYDESHFQYSNPILHIANKINPSKKYPQQPYTLNAEEFKAFHAYINQHGSSNAKNKLNNLAWMKENSLDKFKTTLIKTKDSQIIIVPQELANDIPRKRSWPNWLFKGANIRYELFKDSLFLMAHLKAEINVEHYFIDCKNPDTYTHLLDAIYKKEQLIDEKRKELVKAQLRNLPFFDFTTKFFLKRWEHILAEQKLKIVVDKLLVAEKLLADFESLASRFSSESHLQWTACKHLLELSTELQNYSKTALIDINIQKRIDAVIAATSKHAASNQAVDLIQQLANGKLISQQQLDYLAGYIDRLVSHNPNSFNAFKALVGTHVSTLTESVLEHCISELKNDPFQLASDKDLAQHQNRVCCNITLLSRLGSDNNKRRIEKHAKKYCLRLLHNLMTCNFHKYANHIATALGVLQSLGAQARWLDKDLYDHIKELLEQKRSQQNEKFFKVKCKSLILSLGLHFTQTRMDKELSCLDDELFATLKSDSFLYEEANIKVLQRIRDEMVATGRPLEAVVSSPSEKVLVGINHLETSKVQELLKLSAHAHHIKHLLHREDVPMLTKPAKVHQLSLAVSQFFAKPNNECYPIYLKNKAWFKKQYIAPEVLEPTSPSNINNSNAR